MACSIPGSNRCRVVVPRAVVRAFVVGLAPPSTGSSQTARRQTKARRGTFKGSYLFPLGLPPMMSLTVLSVI